MSWRHYANGKYHEFRSWKVYSSYRERIREDLYFNDYNNSFTGQFLSSGFETFGLVLMAKQMGDELTNIKGFKWFKKDLDPTDNWHGTSTYKPDTMFTRGDRTLIMSLQGHATPYNNEYKELFKTCSIKYICMKIGGQKIYEDWTGNLPNKEIVDKFKYNLTN